jgi:transposase
MTIGKPTVKFHPAEPAFGYSALRGLIALYARLTGRGKPHKAALTACARKLLIYANTVVQRGTPWIEKTASI